jgi:RimJ/RimL family protein N-acetyltransferase
LRLPSAADLEPFIEIHEDPDVKQRMVVIGQHDGRASAWRMLAIMMGHWQIRGYGQWTVVEKATDEVVGRVGLWHPEGWPGLEVGWVIRRSRWGQGVATEAARVAIGAVGADHLISLLHGEHPNLDHPSSQQPPRRSCCCRFSTRSLWAALRARRHGAERPHPW